VRTVEPATVEEVAELLRAATRSNQRVVIRGGGTKWEQSSGPDGDTLLSTRRLNRVLAHRHGDLTTTVEAGAVLDEVNRELARRGQWIPLDPPRSDRATIGGIVATNDSGPRRHRYGAPRDLIIGVEIARADGVRAKAGGIVVKNVAGYDVARLMAGSYGCLAVILSATFKLYPCPTTSATVVAEEISPASAGAIVAAIEQNQLTPTAIEIQTVGMTSSRLLMRFESIEASVEQQSACAARVAAAQGTRTTILRGDDEDAEWSAHRERPWNGTGAVAKITCLPTDVPATLEALGGVLGSSTKVASENGCAEAIGRAGVGVLLARFGGDVESQSRAVDALRRRSAPGRGSVVLLRASDELESAVGRWGPLGDAFDVMRSLKRTFDPNGTLNPGRGPGGL
jgi:glycolate oxidase FAD binding subunit